jgi:hypothetical protein
MVKKLSNVAKLINHVSFYGKFYCKNTGRQGLLKMNGAFGSEIFKKRGMISTQCG